MLAGIRAARPADTGTGPWRGDVLPVVVAFECVLVALLVALWVVARRRPEPGYPAGILRAGLFRAIPIGMVAIAVLAALSHLQPRPSHQAHKAPPPAAPKLTTPRGFQSAAAQNTDAVTYLLYALVALLLLAAIVACVVFMLRRQLPRGAAGEVLLPDDDEALRDAIESGRRSLRMFDDAQAAIIACYVAMEASLASAGAARGAGETPYELLARADGSGLLQGGASGRLTALFYEARYSSHALPASARDEAVQALDEISADLAHRHGDSQLSETSAAGDTP